MMNRGGSRGRFFYTLVFCFSSLSEKKVVSKFFEYYFLVGKAFFVSFFLYQTRGDGSVEGHAVLLYYSDEKSVLCERDGQQGFLKKKKRQKRNTSE